MGIVADRLENLHIEALSPDGQVTGFFRPLADLSIEFRHDGYRKYTERGLEHQLNALIGLLWTDYRNARRSAVAEATGRPATEHLAWNANSRRYRAERDDSDYQGMSQQGGVFVRSTGLRTWNVLTRDGVLSKLDEDEFGAELTSGYAAMMRDCHTKLNTMRDKHFPR